MYNYNDYVEPRTKYSINYEDGTFLELFPCIRCDDYLTMFENSKCTRCSKRKRKEKSKK